MKVAHEAMADDGPRNGEGGVGGRELIGIEPADRPDLLGGDGLPRAHARDSTKAGGPASTSGPAGPSPAASIASVFMSAKGINPSPLLDASVESDASRPTGRTPGISWAGEEPQPAAAQRAPRATTSDPVARAITSAEAGRPRPDPAA